MTRKKSVLLMVGMASYLLMSDAMLAHADLFPKGNMPRTYKPQEYYYASPDTEYDEPPPSDNALYAPQNVLKESPYYYAAGEGLGASSAPERIEYLFDQGYQNNDAAYLDDNLLPFDRDKLLELGRKFVKNIGNALKKADDQLAQLDADDLRMQKYFDGIPDGETMILDISLGRLRNPGARKLKLSQPVTAIKQRYDLFISLRDFFSAANFPIRVNGDEGTAEGWFIRETQRFKLSLKEMKVRVGQRSFPVVPAEVIVKDGDIFVKGRTLALWFGVQMKTNIQGQFLELITAQSWPAQEKEERTKRAAQLLRAKPAQLPFYVDPYSKAEVPNADVFLSSNLRRAPGTGTDVTNSYTVQTAGDLAGFALRTTVSGDQENPLSRLTTTFSRQSEKPDLLGRLKARFYEFNDIRTVNVPGTGAAEEERGFHATNTNPLITYDTSTQVDGIAPPGWDIELYRDLQFVQGTTADSNGRYLFSKVTLFAGDNRFRIVQYGPQGEIKEEFRTLSVAPGAYGGGLLYDFSISQQDTQTYSAFASRDPDKNTPHLAGNIEYQLSDTLILREGLNARKEGGKQKFYLHTGLVKSLPDILLNADVTQDASGPFTSSLTARRTFGRHSASGSIGYTTKNFQPGIDTQNLETPGSFTINTEMLGPLDWRGHEITYNYREGLLKDTTGIFSTFTGLTLSSRIKNLYISHDLNFNTGVQTPGANNNDYGNELLGALSFRGRAFSTQWRVTGNYRAFPDAGMLRFDFDTTRNFTPQLSTQLQFSRSFSPTTISSIRGALNWIREHETISPAISYDSDKKLSVNVNVRFGLSRNPYTGQIVRSATSLSNYGSVSAFVFLDKDGDGQFSKTDQPLPGITIAAVQDLVRAETDDNGEAFLYNLPISEITDIVAEDSTAFEPNWVPGFPGVSIRPRAGHTVRLNFPIWQGGEMDGTAYTRLANGSTRPLQQVRLYLYDGDGRLKMSAVTAPDGYYIFERIPPGKYYLVADPMDLKEERALPIMPQPLQFTFDGTKAFGKNLYFNAAPSGSDMLLWVAPDISDYLKANPKTTVPNPNKYMTIINLGSFHSRILASVVWYKLKKLYPDLVADAIPLVKPSDIQNSEKTGLHTLRIVLKNATTQQAYDRCLKIVEAQFSCAVEIMPKGISAEQKPDQTEKKSEKS